MGHLFTVCLSLGLACTLASVSLAEESADWGDDWGEEWQGETTNAHWLTGYIEQALGSRWQSSAVNDDTTLADSRIRLETNTQAGAWRLTAKGDVYYDGVLADWGGQLRELSAVASFNAIDIKAGRQILTWGTGDYLFINDLFPKDWQSFFAGRDDEYLKAASDAIKISYYHDKANINLVWTPEFDPDNYLRGDYFSFYDRVSQSIAAPKFHADAPNNSEMAMRLYQTLGSSEWALYAYDGYYKSPNTINRQGLYTFSRLQTIGGSLRQPFAEGLINIEAGYYHSQDDKNGTNPLVSNSQWRALLGYEQELLTRLTGSFQVYVEHTTNYSALIKNSPTPAIEPEQNRTVITSRLSWRDVRDKLSWGVFLFYSPSDEDGYLRPNIGYRWDDRWQFNLGANVFWGETKTTFFGQLEDNNNVYARARWAF